MPISITTGSSRRYLLDNALAVQDYLRDNHLEEDRDIVFDLMFRAFPDEGKKLIQNDSMPSGEKLDKLLNWILHSAQITCLIFGDQNMGKDSLICRLFELVIDYCEREGFGVPRFVTLGNVDSPPFVSDKDMYFDLKDIPFGTKYNPVYIYSSELEAEFPARDFQGAENKEFAILQNTFRQNHQKLFGAVKLAANVDISVLRSCNLKIFKYISPEKLQVGGVERENLLTDLGRWFLPNDVNDKSQSLLVFDGNLLSAKWRLPTFWSQEYSEQFSASNISIEKVYSFIRSKFGDHEKLTTANIISIQRISRVKFRKKLSSSQIRECLSSV